MEDSLVERKRIPLMRFLQNDNILEEDIINFDPVEVSVKLQQINCFAWFSKRMDIPLFSVSEVIPSRSILFFPILIQTTGFL